MNFNKLESGWKRSKRFTATGDSPVQLVRAGFRERTFENELSRTSFSTSCRIGFRTATAAKGCHDGTAVRLWPTNGRMKRGNSVKNLAVARDSRMATLQSTAHEWEKLNSGWIKNKVDGLKLRNCTKMFFLVKTVFSRFARNGRVIRVGCARWSELPC